MEKSLLIKINSFVNKILFEPILFILKEVNKEEELLKKISNKYNRKLLEDMLNEKIKEFSVDEKIENNFNNFIEKVISLTLFDIYNEYSKEYDFLIFWETKIENFVFEKMYNVNLNLIEKKENSKLKSIFEN